MDRLINDIVIIAALSLLSLIIFLTLVWSITGLVQYFHASLTYRVDRKVLLQMVAVTSACYGFFIGWGLIHDYVMQANIYVIGAIILFIMSFKVPFVRRKTYRSILIWSAICILWAILIPIPSEFPWFLKS